MSFVTQLHETLETALPDPKDHRTWPAVIQRLRGHRDERKGVEWLFSRELYDRLGLNPRERRRAWNIRRVAADMRAHGWKRQYVGPRSARESGYCRALTADASTVEAAFASPSHDEAVEAFRATLNRLDALRLTERELDLAYQVARRIT